jgi:predicted nucleotidyltransferase
VDWEDWLRDAARRPSDHEDSKRDRTEKQIKDALSSYEPLKGRPYRVYVKGSYANNTNVRLNYDVDIAVEYYGYFYSELCFDLEGHDKSEVGLVTSDDPYTRDEFTADTLGALEAAFGKSAITAGRIAYRVREKKTTLPADVVPCWEYRRYDRIDSNSEAVYQTGSRLYPTDGGHVENYPKIQLDDGIAKNNRTSRRYKRMVRCLKRMQTHLVEQGTLDDELASYLIECLVYNVPDSGFGASTYLADFRSVVGCIWAATQVDGDWNDWLEVHGLKYLFRGKRLWTRAQVHTLVDKAWNEVGVS